MSVNDVLEKKALLASDRSVGSGRKQGGAGLIIAGVPSAEGVSGISCVRPFLIPTAGRAAFCAARPATPL